MGDAFRRGALAALVFILGCGGSAENGATETLGTSRQEIVDGDVDPDDSAVVALLGADGEVYCSGVLVSPNVVATAAHCVTPTPPEAVYFGAHATTMDGTTIEVADSVPHPDFSRDTLSNDVAVVRLAKEVRPRPLPLRSEALDDSFVGESIRIIGFGVPQPNGSVLRKRSGTTAITRVGADDFRFDAEPSLTCLGDSGGPALATIDGREVVIGLASSGDADCKTYGRHTRVDRHAEFIGEYIDANAPSAPALVASAGCVVSPRPRGPIDALAAVCLLVLARLVMARAVSFLAGAHGVQVDAGRASSLAPSVAGRASRRAHRRIGSEPKGWDLGRPTAIRQPFYASERRDDLRRQPPRMALNSRRSADCSGAFEIDRDRRIA